jgi:hypothetical protein
MADFDIKLSVTSESSLSLCAQSAPASTSGPASGDCRNPEKPLQAPPGANLPHDFNPGGANIFKWLRSFHADQRGGCLSLSEHQRRIS